MQLNLSQVTKLFSVPETTVTRWIQHENMPAHEVNSLYWFDRLQLLEWAAMNLKQLSPSVFEELNGSQVAAISLADALECGGVALRVEGNDRYEVFRNAVADLPIQSDFDRDKLLDLLMAREKSGGVAVGFGLAIPHPRYPVVLPGNVSVVRVCFLEHALDYQANDGKPVDTLFLMICPTVHEHLRLLARLASVLRTAEFRNLLASRPNKSRLVSAVRAEEQIFAEQEEVEII